MFTKFSAHLLNQFLQNLCTFYSLYRLFCFVKLLNDIVNKPQQFVFVRLFHHLRVGDLPRNLNEKIKRNLNPLTAMSS
jgi:hypothetical protein